MSESSPLAIARQLIRFNSENPPGSERDCVLWVERLLSQAGFSTQLLGASPERPNLVARLPGRGEGPPLLLQGHVDVVPVAGQTWRHPPFEAVVEDGFLWGRGALDMKGGVAMMLAALLALKREGFSPAGDLVVAILADEEAGGDAGAKFLVEQHAEQFQGIRWAMGEFGGFCQHLGGRRFYPIQVAEKQLCRVRAVVRGPGGHGALGVKNGAMAKLGRLLTRLEGSRLPAHLTPVAKLRLEAMTKALSGPTSWACRWLARPGSTERTLKWLGARGRGFATWLCHTATPTVVRGGEAANVVPSEIELRLDGRVLPGFGPESLLDELRALLGPEVELTVERFDAGPPAPDLAWFDTLAAVLREADPEAVPVPMLLPAVTDARHFARLGIQTYGFLPMNLPPGFDFTSLIHAADERIPVAALEWGSERILAAMRRYR